jgi:hypothetical protein
MHAVEMNIRPNRINIDTGAYATGKLTRLIPEQDKRWSISVRSRSRRFRFRFPRQGLIGRERTQPSA